MNSQAENCDWDEPTPLADILSGVEQKRGLGRPTKGNEKDHGVDAQVIAAEVDLREANITPLHGQEGGKGVRLKKESARHRVLVYLFAQGGTIRSVFESLGGEWDEKNKRPISGTGEYSYQQLVNIRKQPWFQAELLKVMEENGSPLVEARLQLEMMASLETIIEIRDNQNEKGSTRLAAATSLLDRHLGKPAQVVRSEVTTTTASHEQEANELREELQRLKQEAAHLNAAHKV